MTNDTLHLDEPLLEDLLKTPYFFNGRLLTQEDLTQEQSAQRARRKHLGRAIGSGVAFGLEVVPDLTLTSGTAIVLDVAAGLGIAPDGDILHLPSLVRLRFSVEPASLTESDSSTADPFGDCEPAVTTVEVGDTGLHLLVLRPASGKTGLAPVSGLGNEAAPCNTKYLASGVSFRALAVDAGVAAGTTAARLRNAIASACFGFFETTLTSAMADPFTGPSPLELPVAPSASATPAPGYGLVDRLRASGDLLECEVPLALVNLKDNGTLDFVDLWPVRRALTRPPLSRRWWPLGGSDGRRRAEGEAAMLCFQDHITAMLGDSGLASVTAASRFAFLPGGGFLPVGSGRFSATTFLGPSATAVVDGDFGRLRTLVEESWLCDAFDPGAASQPPLTYFAFPEAGGRWVFFLRRRTDVIEIPPDEDDDDGGSDTTTTEPATKTGTLLVIVPAPVLRIIGEPTVRVKRAATGATEALDEIDAEQAIRLLDRKSESRNPFSAGGRSGGRRGVEAASDAAKELKGARFFLGDELPAVAYLLTVAGDLVGKAVFKEQVTVTANRVLTVTVS